MRVLLVAPPTHQIITTQVKREVEEETGFQPPLGILYIASYLRRNSEHEVKVLDAQVEKSSYDDVRALIKRWQPEMVGVSTTTFTLLDVLAVAHMAKGVDPSMLVCLGGPHVDIFPRETASLPWVDFGVRGEGEETMLELLNTLEGGSDLSHIRGLVWKKDGETMVNAPREQLTDLDSLPFPARDMIPWRSYYSIMSPNRPTTNILTSKGCPYNCTFCYKHNQRRVRVRTPISVVDEMASCREMGIKEIFFLDETFSSTRKRALAICQEILRRGLRIPWGARGDVNSMDLHLLDSFKEAGCLRLHIGVESGTEKVLRNLNKKVDLAKARELFRHCRGLGIKTLAYFMIGNPGETREDILKTIDYACKLDPDYCQFSRTTPMPATELYAQGIRSGLFPEDHWQRFAENPQPGFVPPLWTELLSQQELEALAEYAHKRFYVRPRYILRTVKSLRSPSSIRKSVKAGLRILLKSTAAQKPR